MSKKIYKYKCQICKIQIDSDFFELDHETKLNKIVKKRFHKSCYQKKEQQKKEKDSFYKYIKDNFFNVAIPTLFFMDMVEIQKNCDYENILECCKSIDLINIINRINFKNDRAKTKYIIEVIKSNINKYMSLKSNTEIENEKTENIKHEFLDRNKYRYKNSINFDL